MKKLLKGIFLSGAVGAYIAWHKGTKVEEGQRQHILNTCHDIYTKVRATMIKELGKKGHTKHAFIGQIERAVDTYAQKHNLNIHLRKIMLQFLEQQWPSLHKELKKRHKLQPRGNGRKKPAAFVGKTGSARATKKSPTKKKSAKTAAKKSIKKAPSRSKSTTKRRKTSKK